MLTQSQLLVNTVNRVPDEPFIVFGSQVYTYRRFNESASRLAGALTRLGLKKGDRGAYFFMSTPDIALCEHAMQKMGVITVPVNGMSKAAEVKHITGNSGARILITDEKGFMKIKDAASDMPQLEWIVVKGETVPSGCISLDEIMERESYFFPPVICNPDDVASIIYTSGTTGFPKGAMQTQKSLYYGLVNASVALKVRYRNSRVVCPLPLFNNFGRVELSLMGLYNYGTVILLEKWDTEAVLESFDRWKANYFGGTPTMYIYLLDAPRAEERLRSLKRAFVAGSKCPPEVLREYGRRFPWVTLIEAYGATELCGIVTASPVVGIRKEGSAGLPLGDAEVLIVGESGESLGAGEIGEIVVETDSKCAGYWNDPENTAVAFKEQGWFSGDLGYMDENGYLYLVDRKKDLIIRGGANIFPGEVEEVLYGHPQVKMAAVIGIPDRTKGELPKAYVVPRGRCAEDELLQYCRERLASYKVPVAVEFVGQLPVNNLGKVLRRELREQVLKQI